MEKIYKKGKYELIHNRFINDFGCEADAFDLFDTEKRIHRPFFGFLKVSNTTNIGKIGFDYTKNDYEVMLDEQVSKVI